MPTVNVTVNVTMFRLVNVTMSNRQDRTGQEQTIQMLSHLAPSRPAIRELACFLRGFPNSHR